MGFVTMTNMMLQTMGKAVPATAVAMSRNFLFFLPALFLLSWLLGLTGVEISQPVADACALFLSLPLAVKELRKLGNDSKVQRP
jgi:Na+-driven multidrug efflux pump